MARTTSKSWPCIFVGTLVRETADPVIARAWQTATHRPAPFGELRRLWRIEHCARINPYGSESCPYSEQDCVDAFAQTAAWSVVNATSNPKGYFRAMAGNLGARRAEEKPLARDTMRTNGPQRPGDTRGGTARAEAGPVDVRGASHRPQRIGELLGAFDPRARQGPTTNEQEGPK